MQIQDLKPSNVTRIVSDIRTLMPDARHIVTFGTPRGRRILSKKRNNATLIPQGLVQLCRIVFYDINSSHVRSLYIKSATKSLEEQHFIYNKTTKYKTAHLLLF